MEIKCFASSSKGNCYAVKSGQTEILIECGISFKTIQKDLNFTVANLNGVLLSHSHNDHSRSARDMIKAGIDVFMSEQTVEEIGISGHRVKIVEPKKQLRVGEFDILPFDLKHDVFNLGFLVADREGEKLAYITDSFYCPYRFSGLTRILIECNYALDILKANVEAGTVPVELKNRLLKSHFSLEHVKEFFQANDLSKVQEIYLLHLSDSNSDEARFKREIQELTGKPVIIAGGN